jgi:hypothetical protein
MYYPADLHVSAVQGHRQVHYTQVIAVSCKDTILSLIKIVKFCKNLLKFVKTFPFLFRYFFHTVDQ